MVVSAPSDSFSANAEKKQPSIIVMTRGRKIFVSVILLFYYLAAGFWNSPNGPLKNFVMNGTRVVVDVLGFEQTWNMFGPPLRTWNGHLYAVVTFSDGSSRICEMPRMEKMDLWEKFKREKLRKMFVDNMPTPACAGYLQAICQNVALANADPKNQPVMVSMTVKWTTVPNIDEKNLASREEYPEHLLVRTDIIYRVQPEDLR